MNSILNLNDRLASRRAGTTDEEDTDALDDLGAFGYLRGIRDRGLMLDFRLLNGNSEAFPYTTLERLVFNPSEGLTFEFLNMTVRLRGRNFNVPQANGFSFLQALQRHRVPWVQESEELKSSLKPKEAVIITKIEIKERA